MPRARHVLLLALVLSSAACRSAQGEPDPEPIDARATPVQLARTELDAAASGDALPLDRSEARFIAKAHYRIAARVLSRERYYLGWAAKLAPLDLALGWGEMSDPAVDAFIHWHQGGRWYFWQWDAGSPYHNDAIHSQSANVHVIPASTNLRRALLALEHDDLVRLEGWLVDVAGNSDDEHLSSSMSRTDTGGASCEVLYVTKLSAGGILYR